MALMLQKCDTDTQTPTGARLSARACMGHSDIGGRCFTFIGRDHNVAAYHATKMSRVSDQRSSQCSFHVRKRPRVAHGPPLNHITQSLLVLSSVPWAEVCSACMYVALRLPHLYFAPSAYSHRRTGRLFVARGPDAETSFKSRLSKRTMPVSPGAEQRAVPAV